MKVEKLYSGSRAIYIGNYCLGITAKHGRFSWMIDEWSLARITRGYLTFFNWKKEDERLYGG